MNYRNDGMFSSISFLTVFFQRKGAIRLRSILWMLPATGQTVKVVFDRFSLLSITPLRALL